MITFRKKSLSQDLMPEAIDHLREEGIEFSLIKEKDADTVSKTNSRSLVLTDFRQNQDGTYQITVKDKEFYSWTRKLLENYCSMKILSEDEKERTRTAETSRLGIALDIIEILAIKYDLSIVEK